MSDIVKDEFRIEAFAKYYEELSDTFIDISGAANSLMANVRQGETVFEIGLGTGYFAEQLYKAGYDVRGIQPRDRMLPKLKEKRPNIKLLAEKSLEEYIFDATYDVIISHSSVFLFTMLEMPVGSRDKSASSLVFQSFISDRDQALGNVKKVLAALSERGRFFVNIQTNPLPKAEVGPADDRFIFEMIHCSYHLDSEKVEKTFRTTYRSETDEMKEEHYCLSYPDFKKCVETMGGRVKVTDDRRWVILERA